MKIALLGGSFDPPHIGHYWVGRQLIEKTAVDQVWLIPCRSHPFDKKMSSAHTRLTMTRFLEDDRIKVSDYEITKNTISYSIDTLKGLAAEHKQHQFIWVIGSDQVNDFPKWKAWQNIINDFGLIIFPRGLHSQKSTALPSPAIYMHGDNLVLSTVSSTDIRHRVKEDKPIKYMVPTEVEQYIISNNLYR